MIDPARLREEAESLKAIAARLEALAAAADAVPVPTIAAPSAPVASGLTNPKAFFDALKGSGVIFGPVLQPGQVEGINADLTLGAGKLPIGWMAYALATDYHETGHTMQPVHELGSRAYLDKYDTGALAAALGNTPQDDDDGILYAGRGKPQVTGHRNYDRANKRLHELGILRPDEDLLANPDLMLRMDVATAALIFGMLEGWFTGKTFNHYIRARGDTAQFTAARRIINGQDRATLIAGYAMAFQSGLIKGGWI